MSLVLLLLLLLFFVTGLLQDAEVVSGPHDNNICPDEASTVHTDTTASTDTHPTHPVTDAHPTLSDTDTHPTHPDTNIHPSRTDPEATENAYGSGDGVCYTTNSYPLTDIAIPVHTRLPNDAQHNTVRIYNQISEAVRTWLYLVTLIASSSDLLRH